MSSYIDNPFVCCSCLYPYGHYYFAVDEYMASDKFHSLQKYRRDLSAVIHQVLAVVLPFQRLFNLTSLIQNFATENIVRQCGIASVFG